MPLETAPDHIKLAVDLIEILETNGIDNRTAELALEVVLKDLRAKAAVQQLPDSDKF
ncbi:DUF2496 domain-containing protein [Oceanospirillum linum]|uniref:DUF2496 domain-containing protein n=1 Tax=Oceanospirillum linum TaxID=966 RepID=A0A1T1HD92_OCELI|nr:DUF2496 domain-containing protein [Oceanospirillum linum]OOV87795.1 hypothetical protein BTA35_0207265 [Oceanospirillum linum]SEG12104.1 Protein of unknown function [Oleiphilus messinensis]SMP09416.1 Protein of unknown function [Oceanospirillum linum]